MPGHTTLLSMLVNYICCTLLVISYDKIIGFEQCDTTVVTFQSIENINEKSENIKLEMALFVFYKICRA